MAADKSCRAERKDTTFSMKKTSLCKIICCPAMGEKQRMTGFASRPRVSEKPLEGRKQKGEESEIRSGDFFMGDV